MNIRILTLALTGLAIGATGHSVRAAVALDPAAIPFLERSYFEGRDYYLLQSGRVRLIAQADKAQFGPAFTWMLFDSRNDGQMHRKRSAYNFEGGQGMADSSVEIGLGGAFFTARGAAMETRWTTVDGIPAVEAKWWASGIQVTEQLFALKDKEAFVRRITLDPKNLAGPDQALIRLALPGKGGGVVRDGLLCKQQGALTMGLGVAGKDAAQTKAIANYILDIGPVALEPGKPVTVDTLLVAQLEPDAAKRWKPTVADGDATAIRGLDLAAALKETRESWTKPSTVSGGDAVLNSVFFNAAATLPGEIADNGQITGGPFEYAGVWARDSSNLLTGVVHAGHFELARSGLEYVLANLISDQGQTIVDNQIQAIQHEQLDQMGEIMQALKAYYDWTGDDSLLRKYRAKIIGMVELPLNPVLLDAATGMVHNNREYWERTYSDAYELIYQSNVVYGLRAAAELAEPLGAQDRAAAWRAAADKMWTSTISDPKMKLVENGHLIKRREVNGNAFTGFGPSAPFPRYGAMDPARVEAYHKMNPDSSVVMSIALGVLDPKSDLAKATLDEMESIWNERWFTGGYGRYATSSEVCQIGPWPVSTATIMRAQHDAGMLGRSRRSLEWLAKAGPSGAYLEATPSLRDGSTGIVVWGTGEMTLFAVRHVLGARFDGHNLVLKPAPYPGTGTLKADLRYRSARLKLEIPGPGPYKFAEVNGKRLKPEKDGSFRLPADFAGGTVVFQVK